jgi:SNF2 family DNA or RNA helicase
MIELRSYQKAIVDEELKRNNMMVVAGMGTGKTLSTLVTTSILILRSSLPSSSVPSCECVKNVLIIAPKRVAKTVWVQEAFKYETGLTIRFCEKAVDIKLFLTEQHNHRICVCSVTRIEEIPHGCWDMIILDESTLFGNKMSLRSKEARRICNKVNRRFLLTGTPVHGGYEKLWHQIFLLDGGKALGTSLTKFREKYMRVKYNLKGVVTIWEVNPAMIQTLHNDIRHLVYVVKDNINMPPVLYKNIEIELPAKRMLEYDEFERESIVRFQEERGTNPYSNSKTLAAFAASSRGIKLRQLASGCVYADETNTTYSVTHKEKIEAIKELIDSIDSPILVVYAFQSELKELKNAFPKAVKLDKPEDIDNWNAGKIPMAVAHPASISHGLNLQFGGHNIIWFSLTYDAELYAQLNKRLDRPGQTEIVSVLHLIARGTIDEKVLKTLKGKEVLAENFKNL